MKVTFYQKLKSSVYNHLIKPVIESISPVREVAWGTSIGLLIGLTPTVGIQMWIVSTIWLFCRYALKFRFNLVVGNAMVWISNPFTMGPMYYGFFVTGEKFFSWIGYSWTEISYSRFKSLLFEIIKNPDSSTWDIFVEASRFLFIDLGYPMVLGSLFYAFPFAIVSYFVTEKYLHVYREKKAVAMGITYDEWKEKYEVDD